MSYPWGKHHLLRMKLFNTKTQTIEQFQPLDDQVTLYVAGREPEEERPISNLFLYCTADVLARYLELKGLQVKCGYIVNHASGEDRPRSTRAAEDLAGTMRSLNVHPPEYLSGPASQRLKNKIDILVIGAGSSPAPGDDPDPATTSNQEPSARFILRTATVKQARPETNDILASPMTAEEMLQRFTADALRIYLSQHHYRSPWAHDQLRLEKAAQHAEKLRAALKARSTGDQLLNLAPVRKRFEATLDNDLDTVKGIATLLNLADEILFRAPNDYRVDEAQMALRQMAAVFGLHLDGAAPG
jgi:cysteinyl-tRNA synthetase